MAAKDGIISAAEFVALKARVKAEMKRRDGTGSVTAYAAAAYDYTNVPADKGIVNKEHDEKLRVPIIAVNSSDLAADAPEVPSAGDIELMTTKLTVLESMSRANRGASDCNASCTGMCVSACTTTCTSCTSCSGCTSCTSCSGCSGGCTSCSGCSGGCSGCSGTCSGTCSGCSGTCSGTCSGCSGTCSGSCGGSCGGCSGTCNGTCSGSCMTGCTSCTSSVR